MGMLQSEVLFVMLGIEPSSDFVSNISRELGINKEKADALARDINQQLFDPIRSYLREWEEQAERQEQENSDEPPQSPIGASNRNFGSEQRFGGTMGSANGGVLRDIPGNAPVKPSANASLERAGNFSIEPETPAPATPDAPKKINLFEPDATEADHAETLHAIENPTLNRQQATAKADAEHYEPLVDQLLNGPAAIPLEKITVKVPIDIPAESERGQADQSSKRFQTNSKPSAPKPPVNLPTGDPYREAIK